MTVHIFVRYAYGADFCPLTAAAGGGSDGPCEAGALRLRLRVLKTVLAR